QPFIKKATRRVAFLLLAGVEASITGNGLQGLLLFFGPV
ncbi:MAG: hypothetical protein RLZZ370_1048, partial [Bacteroidota bacterium]